MKAIAGTRFYSPVFLPKASKELERIDRASKKADAPSAYEVANSRITRGFNTGLFKSTRHNPL